MIRRTTSEVDTMRKRIAADIKHVIGPFAREIDEREHKRTWIRVRAVVTQYQTAGVRIRHIRIIQDITKGEYIVGVQLFTDPQGKEAIERKAAAPNAVAKVIDFKQARERILKKQLEEELQKCGNVEPDTGCTPMLSDEFYDGISSLSMPTPAMECNMQTRRVQLFVDGKPTGAPFDCIDDEDDE